MYHLYKFDNYLYHAHKLDNVILLKFLVSILSQLFSEEEVEPSVYTQVL